MRMMHTKTPDFIQKMHNAMTKGNPGKAITIRGMEGLSSGKWASIKTGQIEEIVSKMAAEPGVDGLELVITADSPEVVKTVLVKAVQKDGSVSKITRCPGVCVFVPSEEVEYDGCENIVTHTTY